MKIRVFVARHEFFVPFDKLVTRLSLWPAEGWYFQAQRISMLLVKRAGHHCQLIDRHLQPRSDCIPALPQFLSQEDVQIRRSRGLLN